MILDEDEITPARVTREIWRWIGVLAIVLLIGGGITYAGHAFGWWLSAQDANHQAVNTQNGYSNQTTLRGEATTDFATITRIGVQIARAKGDASMLTALRVQQAATGDKLCGELNQVTDGLPADQSQWNAANCASGTLSPKSPDYVTGAP